jgi:hypothetical protein
MPKTERNPIHAFMKTEGGKLADMGEAGYTLQEALAWLRETTVEAEYVLMRKVKGCKVKPVTKIQVVEL